MIEQEDARIIYAMELAKKIEAKLAETALRQSVEIIDFTGQADSTFKEPTCYPQINFYELREQTNNAIDDYFVKFAVDSLSKQEIDLARQFPGAKFLKVKQRVTVIPADKPARLIQGYVIYEVIKFDSEN